MASEDGIELINQPNVKNRSEVRRPVEQDTYEGNPRAWAENAGLMCRRCTKFTKEPGCSDDDPLCFCGYKRSEHLEQTTAMISPDKTKTWNQKTHTQPMPTNAIGRMYFKGYRQKYAKYVRLDIETDANTVWDLLTRVWNLEQPSLVISFTGCANNVQLNPRLTEAIKTGLMKTAMRTDTWILSGGAHTGVTKCIGEAITDVHMCQTVPALKKVVPLGIFTWGCVSNRKSLIDKKDLTSYAMEPPNQTNEVSIDCNHSHVILVDDGTQHKFGAEADFRARLEKTIAEKSKARTIVVVVNGGQDTLSTVYSSLQNLAPVLIVEGSGGTADILALAFEESKEYAIKQTDKAGNTCQTSLRVMTETTERIIMQRLEQILKQSKEGDITRYLECIKQCLLFPDMISVFRLGSNTAQDIDLAIFNGLLEANQADVIEQLQLAVMWDRVDLAKTYINTEGLLLQPERLNDVLFSALESDRVDFVKMILKGGVSLRDFLTTETLIRLYDITVETVMTSLLGDNYVSVYPTKCPEETPEAERLEDDDEQKRDLFIWSVLIGRSAMANFFWNEISDGLATALIASVLLDALKNRAKDNNLREELKEKALEFQQLAVGLLNACYEESEDKTFQILLRQRHLWGNVNCINIAIHFNNQVFMAQPVCQALVQKKWWGEMDRTNYYKILLPCLFVPVLLFPCLKFQRVDESTGDKPSKTQAWAVESKENANIMKAEAASVRPIPLQSRKRNMKEKFWAVFSAPVTVFCYNTIFFLGFLMLHSYVMLMEFNIEGPDILEIVLAGWVLTLLIEELRQTWTIGDSSPLTTLRRYLSVRWNLLDMVTFSAFLCGFILRFFTVTFDAARITLAMNLFGFYIRLIHIYSENKILGPKLVMMGKMFEDLWAFMFILLVFITGYGVISHSILYPNAVPSFQLFLAIFRQSYWPMFGELLLEEIEYIGSDTQDCDASYTTNVNATGRACPTETGKVAVPILLALYLLLTNILLLNLLIAVFSNTFQAVQDTADLHWPLLRYKLLEEYHSKPILPPPFSVVVSFYRLIRCCVLCCGEPRSAIFPETMDRSYNENYSLCMFENKNRKEYLSRRMKEVQATTHHKIISTSNRVDLLLSDIHSIADRLSSVESSLSNLAKQLSSSSQDTETVELSDYGLSSCSDEKGSTPISWSEGANIRNSNRRTSTGLRGQLKVSGPKRVIHPVVTRWKRDSSGKLITDEERKVLEFIAIRRQDNKQWSLPEGCIQSDEDSNEVGILVIMKKTLVGITGAKERKLNQLLNSNSSSKLFTGHVQDPRYTDDTGTDVTVANFHDETGTLTTGLKLRSQSCDTQHNRMSVLPGNVTTTSVTVFIYQHVPPMV